MNTVGAKIIVGLIEMVASKSVIDLETAAALNMVISRMRSQPGMEKACLRLERVKRDLALRFKQHNVLYNNAV